MRSIHIYSRLFDPTGRSGARSSARRASCWTTPSRSGLRPSTTSRCAASSILHHLPKRRMFIALYALLRRRSPSAHHSAGKSLVSRPACGPGSDDDSVFFLLGGRRPWGINIPTYRPPGNSTSVFFLTEWENASARGFSDAIFVQ